VSRPRPQRPPALRYRPARRTDVEMLADLGYRAYRVASLEKRREFYTDHPRFTVRDVRVGELDGQIVSSLVLYPFTAFVRGQRVAMTGVGSVAVSPEQRRRGIAEAFLKAMFREMRQEGRALSILYPFRGSFYRKLGYGTVELAHTLAFTPANLPASEEARRTRRLMLPDRLAVQELYARVAQQQGHFALERRPEWWANRLWGYPGEWIVYEGRPNVIDLIVSGQVHLLVNTPLGKLTQQDDYAMRRAALQHGVPYTTTMSAASAACDAIIAMKSRKLEVRSLQEWHART